MSQKKGERWGNYGRGRGRTTWRVSTRHKSTVGIHPNSATCPCHTLYSLHKSTFAPPVATQVRFSLNCSSSLQVQRIHPLAGKPRGGLFLFFSRHHPFPLINVWRDAAAAWCTFFSVSFSSADRSFLSDPPPLCLASPSPHPVAFAVSPHRHASPFVRRIALTTSPPSRCPCHASPLLCRPPPPRVSLVASPPSTMRLPCRVAPFAMRRPCRVTPSPCVTPSPRVALVASPPCHASPLRHASRLSCRPLVTRLPFAMHRHASPSSRCVPTCVRGSSKWAGRGTVSAGSSSVARLSCNIYLIRVGRWWAELDR